MPGFSWMLLAAICCSQQPLLHAGNSFTAVDQNSLAKIVDQIYENYRGKHMFSLAVSIPLKENTKHGYDVDQVLSAENGNEVKEAIKNGRQVYKKDRIVAAEFQRKKGKTGDDIHAEYRVLKNFDELLNKNFNYNQDLLVFYVLGSPCYHKCTDEDHTDNIIQYLDQIKKWKHYAFVFTHVFQSKNPQKATTVEQLKVALENLGSGSRGLGLKNIFRCEKSGGAMECTSCSRNNHVAQYCVSEERDSSPDLGSSPFIMDSQQDSRELPSPRGSRSRVSSVVNCGEGSEDKSSQSQADSGGKKKRNRKERGNKLSANKCGAGLPSQGDFSRNPGSIPARGQIGAGRGEARKVGGRRFGKKRRRMGNKQKGNRSQAKTKTSKKVRAPQSGGARGGGLRESGSFKRMRKERLRAGRKKTRSSQRPGSNPRINQPQRRRKLRKKGKQKRRGIL